MIVTNRSSGCGEGGGKETGARGMEADLKNDETIDNALCTQIISQRIISSIEMRWPYNQRRDNI